MRGRLGVAEQHHVVLDPALAADHREIAPHRAVGQELMPIEEPAENLRHPVGGLLLAPDRSSPARSKVSGSVSKIQVERPASY